MSKAADPFYTRKPVPDEFIDGIGFTGLTPAQEELNRERKYSVTGVDVRKFDKSNKFAWHPQNDPFYGRKPVPDSMIQGIGETGLTKEQEYENRERKYSLSGADVRRFDNNGKFSFHPTNDPYYGRKSVHKAQIEGVGETNLSAAQAYEIRENKAALFDLSTDPFQQLTGTGHRGSVDVSVAPDASVMARRRSSAIAPDAAAAAAAATAHHHSGYDGNEKLAPVQSLDPDQITPSVSSTGANMAVKDSTGHVTGETGHTNYYDQATGDDIAPHEKA